jgi:acetyl-CoA carboxylase biotin carboxyl carrier protein
MKISRTSVSAGAARTRGSKPIAKTSSRSKTAASSAVPGGGAVPGRRAESGRAVSGRAKGAGRDAASGARTLDGAGEATVAMVRELAAILEEYQLGELQVSAGETSVTLRRIGAAPVQPVVAPVSQVVGALPAPGAVPAAAPGEREPGATESNGAYHMVTSPFVGTFYRSPSPEAEAYVQEGQRVEKGQILCIVEAMKLMNEIEADQSGVVVGILVENGQPVEYGQPLFKLSRA